MAVARCLLLDLDGTLVDSSADLAASLNRVVATDGAAPFTVGEIGPMIGDGVGVLVRRAATARGRVADEALIAAFVTDYTGHAAEASRLFDGVAEGLAVLRAADWRLAVCTNKPEAPARLLLRALGIEALFAAVGGGDSFPVRKPDPAHVRATLEAAGGAPERALMVGDHRNDVVAASGAGIGCVFAQWGYGSPEMGEGAIARATRFEEVPALVERLLPAR